MFEQRQDAGVVDALVEDAVEYWQVGDVAGGPAVGMFGPVFFGTADKGFAHGVGGLILLKISTFDYCLYRLLNIHCFYFSLVQSWLR